MLECSTHHFSSLNEGFSSRSLGLKFSERSTVLLLVGYFDNGINKSPFQLAAVIVLI